MRQSFHDTKTACVECSTGVTNAVLGWVTRRERTRKLKWCDKASTALDEEGMLRKMRFLAIRVRRVRKVRSCLQIVLIQRKGGAG